MAEAIGKRAGTIRGDSQDEADLSQIGNLDPAVVRWLCFAGHVGQDLAQIGPPWTRKSGGRSGGTRRGRKIADYNGTQLDAMGRKSLINPDLLRHKSVPLNPVEYHSARFP